MAEDLNDFTQVDPNNDLQVLADYTADISTMTNGVSAYFYSEGWNGTLTGSFEWDFQFIITYADNLVRMFFLSFTNDLGDAFYNKVNGDLLGAGLYKNSEGNLFVTATEYYNSGEAMAEDTYGISLDTTYYCTLKRDESTGWGKLILEVYSDQTRETLLDTLSIDLHGRVDFHYLYFAQSYNESRTDVVDGNCAYLTEISTPAGQDFPAVKTINGISIASIKSLNEITTIDANVKSVNGIT